jgi:hypothetical protein
MKIDYSGALGKALGFCIHPQRWVPYLLADIVFVSAALAMILPNLDSFIYLLSLSGAEANPLLIAPLVTTFFGVLVLFIAWGLVTFWINGAVIHQSRKENEFNKSWSVSGKRYLSILAVTVITAAVGMIVGMVPYIGFVFGILAGLIFFFTLQSVMVKGNGFAAALEDSFEIFKKYPFKVFLMWLVITILSVVILFAFSLPMLALAFRTIMDTAASGLQDSAALINLIYVVQGNLVQFFAAGMILLVGFAITRTFAAKAQTEFYLQVRKTK